MPGEEIISFPAECVEYFLLLCTLFNEIFFEEKLLKNYDYECCVIIRNTFIFYDLYVQFKKEFLVVKDQILKSKLFNQCVRNQIVSLINSNLF